ncbi:NADPH-dependent FMN reductase [Pseudanabaena sp. PCC 6802]|uniref:NADPH-dependent FMN reductase n=1 Tax=Pseudanabaena sp. PCC 6802 TaxID=118173 RepID=UPI0003470341|nr:NAD(P)H-dependent oxidoreductase [Pseudanabaena sp. PCC 6802]
MATEILSRPQSTQEDRRGVKIVGIGGSLRANSHTYQALNLALQKVAAIGANVELLDLRELNLPLCNGDSDYTDNPQVMHLRRTVTQADGIILATPEYHGSVSGVLKNALDLMSFDELSGKVFGLISVLGGEHNSNSLNDLRTIVRWVHGWVIPEQIAIAKAWQAFDSQGNLKDTKLDQRFDKFAHSLVTNTAKLRGIEISS